jgi:hypothetical protein
MSFICIVIVISVLVLSVFTEYYQFELSDIQLTGWHVKFYLLSCATKPVSLVCHCTGSDFIEEYIYLQLPAHLLVNL